MRKEYPKECKLCKSKEKLHVHQKEKRKDGSYRVRYWCRLCNTERMKRYRATPEGKKKVFEAVYRSEARKRNKKAVNARSTLNYAVRNRDIARPKRCERCKEEKTIHGHHEDYDRPLEVTWLCVGCHADRHREMRGKTV